MTRLQDEGQVLAPARAALPHRGRLQLDPRTIVEMQRHVAQEIVELGALRDEEVQQLPRRSDAHVPQRSGDRRLAERRLHALHVERRVVEAPDDDDELVHVSRSRFGMTHFS